MEVSFVPTWADAARHTVDEWRDCPHWFGRAFNRRAYVCPLFLVVGIAGDLLNGVGWSDYWAGLLALVAVGWWDNSAFAWARRVRNSREGPDQPYPARVVIDESGAHWRSGGREISVRWPAALITRHRSEVCLRPPIGLGFWVPKRAFGNRRDFDAFVSEARRLKAEARAPEAAHGTPSGPAVSWELQANELVAAVERSCPGATCPRRLLTVALATATVGLFALDAALSFLFAGDNWPSYAAMYWAGALMLNAQYAIPVLSSTYYRRWRARVIEAALRSPVVRTAALTPLTVEVSDAMGRVVAPLADFRGPISAASPLFVPDRAFANQEARAEFEQFVEQHPQTGPAPSTRSPLTAPEEMQVG